MSIEIPVQIKFKQLFLLLTQNFCNKCCQNINGIYLSVQPNDNSNLLLTNKYLLLLVKNKENEHKGMRNRTRNLGLLSSI